MINYNGGQYILDGKDLYLEYGFVVTNGKSDFLRYPKAKERYSYNWPDENGTEYDLDEVPVFEDPIVSLRGYLVALTEGEFLIKRYQFFTALRKVGLLSLEVTDISETFSLIYLDNPTSEIPKPVRIKDTALKAWQIEINLQTVNYINDIVDPEQNALAIDDNTLLDDGNGNILETT